MKRSAAPAENLAVCRRAFALKHVTASARRIRSALDLRQAEFLPRIISRIFFAQPESGLRYYTKPSPFGVARFHDFLHHALSRNAPFISHDPRIAILEKRLALLKLYDRDRERCQDLFSCKPGDDAVNAFADQLCA